MRVFVTALLALGLMPATAAAGTFHAYGLGLNQAGCPSGWQAQTLSPGKFSQSDECNRWRILSNRDGNAVPQGAFAGASMFTAEGARFTGFSIRAYGTARNGVFWQMAMCQTTFANCTRGFPRSGDLTDFEMSLGAAVPGGSPYYASHLWAGVTCAESSCPDSVADGRAVDVFQAESHAIVEDFTVPGAPSIAGVSTGWNSGQKELTYAASDAGSGVAAVTLTVDGTLHRTNNHACRTLPSGGYAHPIPCLLATDGRFVLNEPGQLADGPHTLTVTTQDASGERAAASQDFLVDNNAPGHPVGLAVEGGDGWRTTNDFSVTWQNPDQGAGSPIAGAYYKVGEAPVTATDGFLVSGSGPTRIDSIRVPGDGDWPIYVWLVDEAGNATHADAIAAHLRLDSSPPTLAFANERDADNPAEVRVSTSDAHSGVAGGAIEIRRRGFAEWRQLETRREGTELIAVVPDHELERGTYELQASASDAVGNTGRTNLRADGQEMVLDLPLRGDTRVGGGLAPRAGGSERTRRVLRVRYGRSAWLRGVLRTGTGPLPDATLAVSTRPPWGGDWQPAGQVVTDASGRYALRLPAGGSREVRVDFAGNQALRPASRTTRLVVRGRSSLRLRPRRLRRGRTIAFVGRVGLLGAAVPAEGKLVQVQYLDGRRWRPAVKLGRTDAAGRFRIRYRFRRISRPTRIYFRILVPAENGWPYATGASRVRIARVRP